MSSGEIAQTAQRPTAALLSGFDISEYRAFSNYATDGREIAVGLRDEKYRKSDNEACTEFSNIYVLMSFYACVSHRIFYCVTT